MGKVAPTLDKRCGTKAGCSAHERRAELLCGECRVAFNDYALAWRKKNLEKVRAADKKWYDSHRPQRVAYVSAHYVKNAERLKAKTARFNAENPEYAARYRLEHPEQKRMDARLRRARKRNVPFEFYTARQILNLYGSDCHICKEPIDLDAPRRAGLNGWERGLQLDHVIPLVCGGSDLIENVRPSHGKCNLSKSQKSMRNLGKEV